MKENDICVPVISVTWSHAASGPTEQQEKKKQSSSRAMHRATRRHCLSN